MRRERAEDTAGRCKEGVFPCGGRDARGWEGAWRCQGGRAERGRMLATVPLAQYVVAVDEWLDPLQASPSLPRKLGRGETRQGGVRVARTNALANARCEAMRASRVFPRGVCYGAIRF